MYNFTGIFRVTSICSNVALICIESKSYDFSVLVFVLLFCTFLTVHVLLLYYLIQQHNAAVFGSWSFSYSTVQSPVLRIRKPVFYITHQEIFADEVIKGLISLWIWMLRNLIQYNWIYSEVKNYPNTQSHISENYQNYCLIRSIYTYK